MLEAWAYTSSQKGVHRYNLTYISAAFSQYGNKPHVIQTADWVKSGFEDTFSCFHICHYNTPELAFHTLPPWLQCSAPIFCFLLSW